LLFLLCICAFNLRPQDEERAVLEQCLEQMRVKQADAITTCETDNAKEEAEVKTTVAELGEAVELAEATIATSMHEQQLQQQQQV